MSHIQADVLRWAAAQPAITGAAIFGAGLVYAFHGFRLFRSLLAVSCAALACGAGLALGVVAGAGQVVGGVVGAVIGGVFGLRCEKPAAVLASSAVWGLLGAYLGAQIGLPAGGVWAAAWACALLGGLFMLLCYRTMTIVLTTAQGVALLVVGWVALSSSLVPSVGGAFRAWSGSHALLVPVFLTMLFVTGYSYQAMHRQGDIRTGQ